MNQQLLASILSAQEQESQRRMTHQFSADATPVDPGAILKNSLIEGMADIPDMAYQAMRGPWNPMMPQLPLEPTPVNDYLRDQGITHDDPEGSGEGLHILGRIAPSFLLGEYLMAGRAGRGLRELGERATPVSRAEKLGEALDAPASEQLPTLEEQLANVAQRAQGDPEAMARLQTERQVGELETHRMLEAERARGTPARRPELQWAEEPDPRERLLAEANRPYPLAPTEASQQQELIARLAPGNQAIMRNLDPNSPGFWEEYRALQAQEHQAAVRDALERQQEQAFGTPDEQENVKTLFKGIAKDPENFQFGGKPESSDLADIVAHYSRPNNPLEVAPSSERTKVIRNKATDGNLYILNADTPIPYTRGSGARSEGIEEGGGKNMYQSAMSWVANNNKKLVPDPEGISPINTLRRVSNTISNYLRHGKVGYIDTSQVSTARNLKELIIDEKNKVFGLREDLGLAARFDGERFVSRHGDVLDDKFLTAMIENTDPHFKQGIGLTTLKRAYMTKWAMSAKLSEVKAVAKKFKEPILYALSGLTVAKAADSEKLGNLLDPEQD
jgi:hypothetical protein